MSSRLDVALVEAGLARSRSQAQTLIRAGRIGVDGHIVTRPSTPVSGQSLELVEAEGGDEAGWIVRGWVGRGAVKLDHALNRWPVPVAGRRCLDVGASTGGFTQVLLERGARSVVALDVGHDQLDASLVADDRVLERSGTSVRDVSADDLGGPVDLLVSDLSFISVELVLPRLASLSAPGADLVLLVKPQFEVGRAALGRTGVVRSAQQRAQVLARLEAAARRVALAPQDIIRSPIEGASGNIEYLWWLRRCTHTGSCAAPDTRGGMMGCGPTVTEMEARRRALTQEEDA